MAISPKDFIREVDISYDSYMNKIYLEADWDTNTNTDGLGEMIEKTPLGLLGIIGRGKSCTTG